MNDEIIYETYIHLGLRNTAVRLELQPIHEKRLPDEKLSWEVNKIVTGDEEHRNKMGSKNASVDFLDAEGVQCRFVQKIAGFAQEKASPSSTRKICVDPQFML